MSQTYSIGCCQCKIHLWIGQSSTVRCPPLYLYGGDDGETPGLRDFLVTHMNHPLVFGENCEGDPIGYDWNEMDVDTGEITSPPWRKRPAKEMP